MGYYLNGTIYYADGCVENVTEITLKELHHIQRWQGGILKYFGYDFKYKIFLHTHFRDIDLFKIKYISRWGTNSCGYPIEIDNGTLYAECQAIIVDGFGRVISPQVLYKYYLDHLDQAAKIRSRYWRGRSGRSSASCGSYARAIGRRKDLADEVELVHEYGDGVKLRGKVRNDLRFLYSWDNEYDWWHGSRSWKDQSKAKRQYLKNI